MAKKESKNTHEETLNNDIDVSAKYDRFDLEQEIIRCWEVVEDLKRHDTSDEYIQCLAPYYEAKFQRLWDIFDDLVHTKQLR